MYLSHMNVAVKELSIIFTHLKTFVSYIVFLKCSDDYGLLLLAVVTDCQLVPTGLGLSNL